MGKSRGVAENVGADSSNGVWASRGEISIDKNETLGMARNEEGKELVVTGEIVGAMAEGLTGNVLADEGTDTVSRGRGRGKSPIS